jgi:hypothetical protein
MRYARSSKPLADLAYRRSLHGLLKGEQASVDGKWLRMSQASIAVTSSLPPLWIAAHPHLVASLKNPGRARPPRTPDPYGEIDPKALEKVGSVGTSRVVVFEPVGEDALEMTPVKDQNPVQALAPSRADLPLHVRIGLGRCNRRSDHLDAFRLEDKIGARG